MAHTLELYFFRPSPRYPGDFLPSPAPVTGLHVEKTWKPCPFYYRPIRLALHILLAPDRLRPA